MSNFLGTGAPALWLDVVPELKALVFSRALSYLWSPQRSLYFL